MKFLKGAGLVIICILFFIFLIIGNSLLTLSFSLSYENVKPEIMSVGKNLINQEIDANLSEKIEENYALIQEYCKYNQEYVFDENGYGFVISCDTIDKGVDAVIDENLENLVDEVYYKDYNCSFFNCFSEEEIPFFLISEKAQNYWQGKFYLVLLILIILLTGMFFLVENKQNFFIISGSLLIASSLPFSKLDSLIIAGNNITSKLLGIFISEAKTVFMIILILGIIIFGVGISWYIFKAKSKIGKKSNKK